MAKKNRCKNPRRKIQIKEIDLRLAEGRVGRMGRVVIKADFQGEDIAHDLAAAVIREWAKGAARGYYKLDFIVTWMDGETYTGTFLLEKKHRRGKRMLRDHMRWYLKFHSGVKPSNLTNEQYEGYFSRMKPDTIRRAKKILKGYRI